MSNQEFDEERIKHNHQVYNVGNIYTIAFPIKATHKGGSKLWGDFNNQYKSFYLLVLKMLEWMKYKEFHENTQEDIQEQGDPEGGVSDESDDPDDYEEEHLTSNINDIDDENYDKLILGKKIKSTDVSTIKTAQSYATTTEIYIEKVYSTNKKEQFGYIMYIFTKAEEGEEDIFQKALKELISDIKKNQKQIGKHVSVNLTSILETEEDYNVHFDPNDYSHMNIAQEPDTITGNINSTSYGSGNFPRSAKRKYKKRKSKKVQIKTLDQLKHILNTYLLLNCYGKEMNDKEIRKKKYEINESNITKFKNLKNLFKPKTAVGIMKACGYNIVETDNQLKNMVQECKDQTGSFEFIDEETQETVPCYNHINLMKSHFNRVSFKDFTINGFKANKLPFELKGESELIQIFNSIQNEEEYFGSGKRGKLTEDQKKEYFKDVVDTVTKEFSDKAMVRIGKNHEKINRLDTETRKLIRKTKKPIMNVSNVFKLLKKYHKDEFDAIFTKIPSKLTTRGEFMNFYMPKVRKYYGLALEKLAMVFNTDEHKIIKWIPLSITKMIEWKNKERRNPDDGKVYFFNYGSQKTVKVRKRKKNGATVIKLKTKKQNEPLFIPYFDRKLDSLSNFLINVSQSTQYILYLQDRFSEFILTVFGTNDQFNDDYKLHLNLFLEGRHAVGKSFLFDQKEKLSIDGTCKRVSDLGSLRSDQSSTLKGYITYIYDEAPPEFSQGNTKMGNNARIVMALKTKLTSMIHAREVHHRDENGEAITVYYVTDVHQCVLMASNYGHGKIEKALGSRFIPKAFTLNPFDDDIQTKKDGAKLQKKMNPEYQPKFVHMVHDLQFLSMLTYMSMNSLTQKKPETLTSSIVLTKFNEHLTKKGLQGSSNNQRRNEFIEIVAKTLTILKSWIEVCLIPGSYGFRKPFEYTWIREAEKYQVITLQTMITSICLLFNLFENPTQKKLVDYVGNNQINIPAAMRAFDREIIKTYNATNNYTVDQDQTLQRGFTKVNNFHHHTELNYHYHLYIIKWWLKKTNAEKINFAIKRDSQFREYYDLNYFTLQYKNLKTFLTQVSTAMSPSISEKNLELFLTQLSKYHIKPDEVLKYVGVNEFDKEMETFMSSPDYTNISIMEFNDLMQQDNDHTHIFKYLKKDGKNHYLHKKFKNDLYNPNKGLPAVKFRYVSASEEEKIAETSRIGSDGNGYKRGGKKTNYKGYWELSFLVSLRRLDIQQFLVEAIKSLEYQGLRKRKILLPIRRNGTREFQVVNLEPNDKPLRLRNAGKLMKKENRNLSVVYGNPLITNEKDDETEEEIEESDNDDENVYSDDEDNEDGDGEINIENAYEDNKPSAKQELAKFLAEKEIKLTGVDIDDFSRNVHLEEIGVPYNDVHQYTDEAVLFRYKKYLEIGNLFREYGWKTRDDYIKHVTSNSEIFEQLNDNGKDEFTKHHEEQFDRYYSTCANFKLPFEFENTSYPEDLVSNKQEEQEQLYINTEEIRENDDDDDDDEEEEEYSSSKSTSTPEITKKRDRTTAVGKGRENSPSVDPLAKRKKLNDHNNADENQDEELDEDYL